MLGDWSLGVAVGVFAAAALVTVIAGWRISSVGDVLADRLGLGEALFGGIFFGAVISLSGIVMTATAAVSGKAGLAYGNAVGGVAAQTAALVAADAVYRRANLEHAAASLQNMFFAVLVCGLLAIVIAIGLVPATTLWGIHPGTLVLLVVYVAGAKVARTINQIPLWAPERTQETVADEPDEEGSSHSTALLIGAFLVLGALVSCGGWAVARASSVIVDETGLSQTFVGAGIMGIVNALPELITSIAAVRRGAVTLAVAGVLGGNAFDVLNVAVGDVAYRSGSLYHAVGSRDGLMTVAALVMTILMLAGMLRRQRQGPGNVGFEGVLLVVIWLGAVILAAFA